MKDWFDTHSKRANHALFKKIKTDPDNWNVVLTETEFLPVDSPDQRRLWHYYNGVFEIPKCAICGKELRYVNFSGSYSLYLACRGRKKTCEVIEFIVQFRC